MKHKMLVSAMEWANRKGIRNRQAFSTADAHQLPFNAGSLDIVISESVNIFFPDRARAVSEFIRVAKSAGFVGLNEPILIGQPTARGAAALAKVVGQILGSSQVWEELLNSAGISNLAIKTSAEDLRTESRNQSGFFTARDYLRIIGRIIRT